MSTKIKIPHSLIETSYSYYIEKYGNKDYFDLSHYRKVTEELITKQSKHIQLKQSKKIELKVELENQLKFKIDLNENILYNICNSLIKGDIINFSDLKEHVSLDKKKIFIN